MPRRRWQQLLLQRRVQEAHEGNARVQTALCGRSVTCLDVFLRFSCSPAFSTGSGSTVEAKQLIGPYRMIQRLAGGLRCGRCCLVATKSGTRCEERQLGPGTAARMMGVEQRSREARRNTGGIRRISVIFERDGRPGRRPVMGSRASACVAVVTGACQPGR